MTEPGAVALARAIEQSDPNVDTGEDYDDEQRADAMDFAVGILAALSPADKLAIAGITEERLAAALGVWAGPARIVTVFDARAILAALSVTP